MGALVTLELGPDAPQLDLPWIITFGPLEEDEEWEPVVCGPYERPHALALAQHIVADEDLMAVVEPVLPATSLEQIREEIANVQRMAERAQQELGDLIDELDEAAAEAEQQEPAAEQAVPQPPTAEEVRLGFARISSRLTATR